ncbi:hypothetical protein EKK58_06040 [Candidatus Dependentiae bacterium]|nr:MAG: hypothetical protein EKK58_06040 [Candidatus Dependentiae bacterium]
MEKITITKAYRQDKDKEGKPLMTKAGKPYAKLALKTKEYGEATWLSGFSNKTNEKWTEGSVVEVTVTKQERDGKVFYNFETPKAEDVLAARVSALELDVLNLKKALASNSPTKVDNTAPVEPEETFEDIEF